MNWVFTGALLLACAVGLGAFGAHALKGRLDTYALDVYHTAVLYHFLHALGILAIAALARSGAITAGTQSLAAALLLAGIVLFSGSLYALALTGIRVLGAVTPLGGVAFIAGWLVLAWQALGQRGQP